MTVPGIGKTVINKTNPALVLVELNFRESQTTKKELLRKNSWQLLKKEMSQLLFM